MAMKMPKILNCTVTDCSYNSSKVCHAMAITVGSSKHPICYTFLKMPQKGGAMDMTGSVGACKESDCKYNKSLECTASGINVGMHKDHADCTTFSSR